MTILSFPLTLSFEQMPLAVYRELSAHLQQLSPITLEMLPPDSPHFDYHNSQIGGIRIHWQNSDPENPTLNLDRQRFREILAYYHDRYPLRDASCLDL